MEDVPWIQQGTTSVVLVDLHGSMLGPKLPWGTNQRLQVHHGPQMAEHELQAPCSTYYPHVTGYMYIHQGVANL